VLNRTDFDTFRRYAGQAPLVPVCREVLADLLTPVSAFLRIDGPTVDSFLLESVEGGERVARYSFLGRDPFLTLTIRGGRMTTRDARTGEEDSVEAANPVAGLRTVLSRYRAARVPGLPRFSGGAVGWFAYDSVRWIEALLDAPPDDLAHEDVVLKFFDTLLAFDHARQRILILAHAHVGDAASEADLRRAYDEASLRIDALADRLAGSPARNGAAPPAGHAAPPASNLDRARFEAMVETALEHIRAGDIFQVVLSQRFAVPTAAAPFDVYRALRAINPSPYTFFLNFPERPVLGASPEPLVRLQDGVLEYRPIAGTTPRGATEEEDRERAARLLADEKERAEHIMLVDLGRNDLGRVAEPGSVVVADLMAVEKYSHVFHLVTRLTARLRPGMDALDALFACFPAGTVSGAPKVRAMEIIDALEPTRRGLYAGAVGYLDFSGNLDTCIALRTMQFSGGTAYVQAGAGIVADSRPGREFEETLHKARALLSAIETAERGLESR
jgi:anthranilate synthase component 1